MTSRELSPKQRLCFSLPSIKQISQETDFDLFCLFLFFQGSLAAAIIIMIGGSKNTMICQLGFELQRLCVSE